MASEGVKRSLTIKKCNLEDAGRFIAKTNAESTETELIVKCTMNIIEQISFSLASQVTIASVRDSLRLQNAASIARWNFVSE